MPVVNLHGESHGGIGKCGIFARRRKFATSAGDNWAGGDAEMGKRGLVRGVRSFYDCRLGRTGVARRKFRYILCVGELRVDGWFFVGEFCFMVEGLVEWLG